MNDRHKRELFRWQVLTLIIAVGFLVAGGVTDNLRLSVVGVINLWISAALAGVRYLAERRR